MLQFWRPLSEIDRVFISDDLYYTLTISRSIAHGLGPTTDGVHLTSGFQPLLGFLLVPFVDLGFSPDMLVRLDLLLLIACDVLSVWLLAVVAWRLIGPTGAILAASLWALSPVAMSVALSGLEGSLAVMCDLALVVAWMWANDAFSSRRRAVVVGVFAGLAMLARFDAVVLVGLIAVAQLVYSNRRTFLYFVGAAGAVVLPWWLWCVAEFGTVVPTSVAAERHVTHTASFSSASLSLAAAAVVHTPLTLGDGLKGWFQWHAAVGAAVFVALAVSGILAAWNFAFPGRSSRWYDDRTDRHVPVGVIVAAVLVFGVALLFGYTWFAVIWNLDRYLLPVSMMVTVVFAWIGSELFARTRPFAAVLILAGASLAVVNNVHLRVVDSVPSRSYRVATGSREAALRLLADLPDHARAGAWQSGALSYYASRGIVVVNLDGVVNPQAPNPRDATSTLNYLTDQHVNWLVDWRLMIVGLESATGGRSSVGSQLNFDLSATYSHPGQQVSWLVRIRPLTISKNVR